MPGSGEAKFRDHELRNLQIALAPAIPALIGGFDLLGAFPETRIHSAMKKGPNALSADDITLSQLQMTAHTCKMIEGKKNFPTFQIEFLLTSLLNGADGPVARRTGSVSNEGGIKDGVVDRLSEVMIVRLIAKKINLPEYLSHGLQVAFQLSTLIKAACEMNDVKTSEKGIGGMIQRRKTLFFILQDLIYLNAIPKAARFLRDPLINDVYIKIKLLIDDSYRRARERIGAISAKVTTIEAPNNEKSAGASEARKYAGIVTLNKRMGINIVAELNKVAKGSVLFPTDDSLRQQRKYIDVSLNIADGFLNEALKISGLSFANSAKG